MPGTQGMGPMQGMGGGVNALPPAVSTGMSNNANQSDLYNTMLSLGIPDIHAQGMLANIQGESNYNPKAIGDSGTSFGMFQHHGPRGEALKNYSGGNWQDPVQQLKYALSEPATQRYLSTPFNNWQDAAHTFTTQWERPANAPAKAQQRIAQYQPLAPSPMQGNQSLVPTRGPTMPIPIEPSPSVTNPGDQLLLALLSGMGGY